MSGFSKNIGALFLSDLLSRVLGFIVMVYIAHRLTVNDFGALSYGMAFLTYALLFVNPGLGTIGARTIARDHSNQKIVEDILGLRFSVGIVVFVIFLIGLLTIPGSILTKQIIFVYILSLFPFALLLEFVFQGRERMEYIALSRLSHYVVYLLFVLIFIRTSKDIIFVPFSYFIGFCCATTFLIIIYLRSYHKLRLHFSIDVWKKLLAVAIPVGLATIINQLAINFAPIYLGICYSKEQVALFSAGFKIIVMLLVIERVFYFIFFPVLARQHKKSIDKLPISFTLITRLLFLLTIPIATAGLILAAPIISFIYGMKFIEAAPIFQWLLLYFVITPLNTLFGYGLVAIEREKKFFRIIFITVLLNLSFIIILGIFFKAVGVAIALFVSESFGLFLMSRALKKSVTFKYAGTLLKPFIASLGMGVFLYIMRNLHIFFLIITGCLIYIIILSVLRGMSLTELKKIIMLFENDE